ncbi:hypothetical protein APX70_05525 [Pseudomonas syringae pv. maculicola]|uniref:Uncharacterized protein n=1 Tax=Pseudomonas syringae pv. maculicola TaxID=59511 RepID=A0A3M2VG47_PSEYM|nr:hypothetical protein APX70_05525 [Pseudomonas syringae pv. maculicola]
MRPLLFRKAGGVVKVNLVQETSMINFHEHYMFGLGKFKVRTQQASCAQLFFQGYNFLLRSNFTVE